MKTFAEILIGLVFLVMLVGIVDTVTGNDHGGSTLAPGANDYTPYEGEDFTPYDSSPPDGVYDVGPDADGCLAETAEAVDEANSIGSTDSSQFMSEECLDKGY